MPWCPKCKSQYRESFTKCNDCNVDLVEKLEEDFDDEGISNKILLITANDQYEAQIVKSALESNSIQYLNISNESGGFLQEDADMNNMGIDFYISENDYEFAKKLLESRIDNLVEVLENGEDNTSTIIESRDQDNGNSKSKTILCLIALTVIIILGLIAYQYLR